MLKLKLQYFGHFMQRVDSLEKTLMLGGIESKRRRGRQRMRWLDGMHRLSVVAAREGYSLTALLRLLTVAASLLSLAFSRQEYWSVLPCPLPRVQREGKSGAEASKAPASHVSPTSAVCSFQIGRASCRERV